MKKSIFTLLLSLFVLQSFSQLNPTNNLDLWHIYDSPNNYFNLTWSVSPSSNDTLMGYKIYRNNDLFRFQADDNLTNYIYPINCDEDFLIYNYVDFWIHVTAIYNSDSLESAYIDSVHCLGYAINIDEINENEFTVYPNPTTGKIIINSLDIYNIKILNIQGELVIESEGKHEVDLTDYPKGIYIIELYTKNKKTIKKVILE